MVLTRLRVAATVATARTRRPESSRARCASRAVAPVVRTSSQSTSESSRSRCERVPRGPSDAPPSSPSGWPPARPRVEAGLVVHLTSLLEELDDADAMSATPQSSSCRARHPEHGVVAAGAHHARLGTAPGRARSTPSGRARPGLPRRRTRPSGVASEKVPCSLCERIIARSSPSYSPAAKQAASPSGHGVGRTGIARCGQVVRGRHGTGTGPGSRTADAAAAVHEIQPGVDHSGTVHPTSQASAARPPTGCGSPSLAAALWHARWSADVAPPPRPWTSYEASCRCC